MIQFNEFLLLESLNFDSVKIKSKITPKQFKETILANYVNPVQIKQVQQYLDSIQYIVGYSFVINSTEYWVYMENSNATGEIHLLDITNARYGIGDVPTKSTDGLQVYAGALVCVNKCLDKWSPDKLLISAPTEQKQSIYKKLFDKAKESLYNLKQYNIHTFSTDTDSVDGSTRYNTEFIKIVLKEHTLKNYKY